MPTEPLRDLLDRDIARVQGKEIIDIASPLLQELVNNGTLVFMRCQAEATEGEQDEHLPVLTSYMHILEMTDAIQELVSNSCAYPAMPLLRSSFEALLGMDYILAGDYRKRAFSWMVDYLHRRIQSYELANYRTGRGKEYFEAMRRERAEGLPLPSDEETQELARQAEEAIERLNRLLQKPQYKAAEAEYRAMQRKKKTSRVAWYSLFGGPSNLGELARQLNRHQAYLTLYSKWSSIVHALDVSRFLTKTADGSAAFYQLRNPKELAQIAHLGAVFILDATRLLIRRFRPGEQIAPWYKREVRQPFLWLGRIRVKLEEA